MVFEGKRGRIQETPSQVQKAIRSCNGDAERNRAVAEAAHWLLPRTRTWLDGLDEVVGDLSVGVSVRAAVSHAQIVRVQLKAQRRHRASPEPGKIRVS